MPIWPFDLSSTFSVFPFPLPFVLLLLANFVPRIRSQATCAFVRADFAQFLVDDTPAQPQIADDLSLCRPFFSGPSPVSCCTRQMEAKFEQFAREQLHFAVSAQIRLISNFFDDWSSNFRTEFLQAINRTEETLRNIFQRTYGHFFTQNIEMFHSFFAHIRSLLFPSSSSASFDFVFRQLLHRIFLAEFALLNPLHSSILSSHEQCMLNFFPAFAPFGSVAEAIVALHGRTFTAWTSFIDALDSVGEAVQSLGKSFSLSSRCVRSVAGMRFCPICLGHSPQLLPCPALCHNILDRCLHNLTTIGLHWEEMIDSLVRLGSSLASVHNPHLSLAPFPFQLSEAVMHFQENAKMLSARILFRCFGDELKKKMVTDGQINLRRKRRRRSNLSTEIFEENLEEEEEEEEEDENREQRGESGQKGAESDAVFPPTASPSSPPLFISVISLRRSIDLFVDRLLRMKGIWRGMGRTVCQEGGIQTENGGSGREGGKCLDRAYKSEGDVERTEGKKQRGETEMTQIEAIAKRVRLANGMATAEEEGGGTSGAERAEKTKNANEREEEGQNDEKDVSNYVDYHSYESVGKWSQWTEVEKHTERNDGQRTTREGGEGIGTTLAISSIFLPFLFRFLCLSQFG